MIVNYPDQKKKKEMNKILVLVIAIIFAGCNSSGDKASHSRQSNSAFWGHRYSLANNLKYGEYEEQKLDIYSQGQWIGEPDYWKSDTKMHPTLIYIHGGGWLGGSKDQITPFILPYLERGWNVVTLEYRKGEATAPLAVNDCLKAIKWVGKNAGDYNIDSQHLVISGESAGGHLALIAGMLNNLPGSNPYYAGDSIKIKAVINWFGISDISGIDTYFKKLNQERNYASIWVGAPQRMDSISKTYSPVHRICASSPPILTIHGQLDSVVPYLQSVTFHKLLEENDVKNELVSIPEGKHLGFTDAEFQQIYTRIFTFLDELK